VTEPEPEETPGGGSLLGSRQALVLGTAALVVLITGAAIGMLITMSISRNTSLPDTGSVDVGFAQDMRVHHLQAVTMSGVTRDHTADPLIHSLAFDIESTQLAQSSEMTGWLTAWRQPELPPPDRAAMSWMPESSGHSHGSSGSEGGVARMPGMATSEELNRLKSATGRDLDILYLQLMLRHHQGALPMAQYAAEHSGVGYVKDLAQKMVSGQAAEVQLMVKMLAERGAKPLPAPG
jgi:uncharacterized protein (DUF305 family)